MCGIAGVIWADRERQVERSELAAMGDAIAHRGPDSAGVWVGPGVGLVHRRLSIIDLEGGHQPIGNEDDSIQVVLNGEIYNYRELRDGLEKNGHRFRTRSDTEVLVHLYEDEGDALVGRLRGMFAFALWDGRRRELLLARDRLGIKPLYVYRDAERLVFGSEVKAILACPGVPREIDVASLENYLAYAVVPGPRSIFRGIDKLPAAHVLTVGADRLDRPPRCYWRLRFEPDERATVNDWLDAVRAKLTEAVKLHMIADVPVGAFLSGGLDSSIVVGLASRAVEQPIQTFSVGFRESAFSELPYARQVAEQYGTRHVEEVVTPDAVSLIDELTNHYDEPFADPSAVPTYLVAGVASRHVKVALSGDGGDEAFGGYDRYAHDLAESRWRKLLPGWFRRTVLSRVARAWPEAHSLPRPLRAKTRLTNLSLDAAEAYANSLTLFRQPLRRQVMARDRAAGRNGFDPGRVVADGYAAGPSRDPLGSMIAADVDMLLPDDFLVKVDRASMAHGLEVRPPLLDHELLELAARIPSRWKVRRGQTKWLLRRLYGDELPGEIGRRPKQGFDMPVDEWLRGPLSDMFESAVFDGNARVGELVDRDTVRRLYDGHVVGAGRHGRQLWAILMLARWADRYLSCQAKTEATGGVVYLHNHE